ncbi:MULTISPECIES: hypothetical protein [unclassified Streptomyces]|uniref:hypothetical protein n=1 Tax=unclassified Streptomyces TaxID=2593676 RepID=UPI0036E2BBA6
MKHRLLGAAVAAGCALAAVGTGPVHAAADELRLQAPYGTVLPAPDANGSARERTLDVQISHDDLDNAVPAGRLTVDASEIASFAQVSWPANCAPESATRAVCDVPAMPAGTRDVSAALIGLRALPDAGLDASGNVRYSATAGELSASDAETRITVGNGPDLGLSQAPWQQGLTPGTDHTVRSTVTNNGNRAVERTLLWVNASYGLHFKERHANCEYRDNAIGTGALCVLDEKVSPGQRYDLVTRLRIGRQALYDRLDHSVVPYSDAALEEARGGLEWTRGEGPELNLRPVAGQRAAAGEDDVDLSDNYRIVALDAKNTADFKVTGSRVRGAAGDTVTARMTVFNRGPAWVASLGAGSPVATLRFQAPAGTSVVGLPEDCWTQLPSDEGPSAVTYYCSSPIHLHDRASFTVDVQLRIDEVVRGARAVVETAEDTELPVGRFDPNLRNNVSSIVVNG